MLCLKQPTDRSWAAQALSNVNAVLVDHAHCEMKAASNALSLIARYPGNLERTRVLADLANEEIGHLQRVIGVLVSRGVALGKPAVDVYAAELRRQARELSRDGSANPLVDRLLVAALIEARSCERFRLLVEATSGIHADLHALWKELFAAEAGHYRTFVDLASRVAGEAKRVGARLEQLAELEAGIVRKLGSSVALPGARASIHG
jgi:tRNA 2-(methylsulfanyl)-N6-isopentenyladenosine37 hydroxylase